MLGTFESVLRHLRIFSAVLELTSGICLTICTAGTVCILATVLGIPAHSLGVDSSVLTSGHVHKLLSYPFIHCDVLQLLLSAGVLVALSGGVERGVGTVRFLVLLLQLSAATGLLFALALLLLPEASASVASGLIPAALSLLGMATISSRMQKAFLLGVSVPMATLPWLVLLVVTLVVPGTVLLCNSVAILVGVIYGKGWLSLLEMSESRAALLEKSTAVRLLKRIMGARFIPASAEERRQILYARCKPPPGSYPVQAYAPTSAAPSTNQTHSIYEGWSYSTYMQQSSSPFPATHVGHGHSQHGHSHEGHGHSQHGHSQHGHSHEGHGHSHEGHGHSCAGLGHGHSQHGHGHEGHGHSQHGHGHEGHGSSLVHGQYGRYAGQYGHGWGVAACGQHAGAPPTVGTWMPPGGAVPPQLGSGLGTAGQPGQPGGAGAGVLPPFPSHAHNPEPHRES